MQKNLGLEQSAHDDLIQHDFLDSYDNLTIKTGMMLRWIDSKGCSKSNLPELIFKVDDDVIVNAERLWEKLGKADWHRRSGGEEYLFMGHVFRSIKPNWGNDKYNVPEDFYNGTVW